MLPQPNPAKIESIVLFLGNRKSRKFSISPILSNRKNE